MSCPDVSVRYHEDNSDVFDWQCGITSIGECLWRWPLQLEPAEFGGCWRPSVAWRVGPATKANVLLARLVIISARCQLYVALMRMPQHLHFSVYTWVPLLRYLLLFCNGWSSTLDRRFSMEMAFTFCSVGSSHLEPSC